ncbi:hypothetical protein FB451DRAFT_1001096, partial [Mycena latifolia]
QVIFARGTGEPQPIGSSVCPPFNAALQAALANKTLAFIGVNYPVGLIGFLLGKVP